MLALIFLLVSLSTFLSAYLFFTSLMPILVDSYTRLQDRRAVQIVARLEESFIFWEKKKKLFFFIIPFLLAGIGFLLFWNPIGLFLGFICGLFLPNFIVNLAARKRIKKFQGQMVDSLTMLTSALKAGLSFIQAIEVLCEEMPAPISQEFNTVIKENKLGVSLEESLRKLRKRIPLEEVNLLVTSIIIARESGGELTKVFSRLTETIRNNIKLKEKVATLTLQGRLQGIIMMILPFVFSYFVYKQNPEHFSVMFQTQQGRMLIIVAVCLQVVGTYLIKRISTYRI